MEKPIPAEAMYLRFSTPGCGCYVHTWQDEEGAQHFDRVTCRECVEAWIVGYNESWSELPLFEGDTA